MRECPQNYAHGPMKLKTRMVTVEYQGKTIECEKQYYGCSTCDHEIHSEWMEKNFQENIKKTYAATLA